MGRSCEILVKITLCELLVLHGRHSIDDQNDDNHLLPNILFNFNLTSKGSNVSFWLEMYYDASSKLIFINTKNGKFN